MGKCVTHGLWLEESHRGKSGSQSDANETKAITNRLKNHKYSVTHLTSVTEYLIVQLSNQTIRSTSY